MDRPTASFATGARPEAVSTGIRGDSAPPSTIGAARVTAENLSAALEAVRFAGWDPYDALSSPRLRAWARSSLSRRAAIQLVKHAPLGVRWALQIPRRRHTKALAVLVSAYVQLASLDRVGRYRGLALELAPVLADRAVRTGEGLGWAYEFDVQTRWGYYKAGWPNAVVTAFAAHALLDVAELTGDGAYGDLARQALSYAESELFVERADARFFAYFAGSTVPVHNANMLMAGVFARCAERLRSPAAAVGYSLEHQRPDGSWPYGEGRGLGWVDGFHTAYVLEGLARWHESAPSEEIRVAIERGLKLYLTRLVDPDGAPRASLASRYPVDIHAASSALTMLSRLRAYDGRAWPTACRVLAWTLRHMRRGDGRFAFQRHRFYRNSTPYVRWNDAHMLLGLASCLASDRADEGAA